MESTSWYFPQCGKYNLNVPNCGYLNVYFPLHGSKALKSSEKLEVKQLILHIVQVKYRAVIALKWFTA